MGIKSDIYRSALGWEIGKGKKSAGRFSYGQNSRRKDLLNRYRNFFI